MPYYSRYEQYQDDPEYWDALSDAKEEKLAATFEEYCRGWDIEPDRENDELWQSYMLWLEDQGSPYHLYGLDKSDFI